MVQDVNPRIYQELNTLKTLGTALPNNPMANLASSLESVQTAKTASYTLTASDNNTIIPFTGSGAQTVTLNTGLPAGFNVVLVQKGTGSVSVTGTATRRGITTTSTQYDVISLTAIGVDEYVGDIASLIANNHTHPISSITNLDVELAARAPLTHIHAIADITGLQTKLNSIDSAIQALQQGGSPGQTPSNTALPVITGTAAVGQTLTVSQGSWTGSPSSFSYQWKRAGADIAGATNSTYLLVVADSGQTITCSVTASNASGSGTVTTAATAAVVSAPGNTVAPSVSGTAAVGQTLTTTNGTWTGSPTGFTYQWRRAGVAISGATNSTYVIIAADAGQAITCAVTATNANGTSTAVSNSVTPVDVPSVQSPPFISGSPIVGQTVAAGNGTWTGSPTFTYQWKRGGTNIAGATNQAYVLVAADEGVSITVTVTATNAAGAASSTSAAVVPAAAGQTANVSNNPVTTALTGLRTFNVGPGQTYLDPDNVPWATLSAGDVVNIYYRATPYPFKFGIRGQGTQALPIIINGVTDANGNRPKFDFAGARTCAGCNPGGSSNVFSATPQYGESLGGIVVKQGPSDPYRAYKPQWVQIKNLELFGARNGASYTTLAGGTANYASAAGIYYLTSADCLVENCVIYDNGFGIFTQAKDNSLADTSERITIRNNRVYDNGVNGSFLEHNMYIQAANPVVEGNYIGQLRAGSVGSSFKDRSSALVFRYNYVEAASRALDIVHSENNSPGISTQPDYGTDFVYGNIIVNDYNLPRGAAIQPIHYGGDNNGEDDATSTPIVDNPTYPYRKQLYFWNNTYIYKATAAQAYRSILFQLSLIATKMDMWNNLIVLSGDSAFSYLAYVGNLNIRGTNLVYGTPADARDGNNPARFTVNKLGTILNSNPLIVDIANGDYRVSSGSPAINAGTTAPSGTPAGIDTTYPVSNQPQLKTNGWYVRTLTGNIDLGALEFGVGTGLPPAQPANTALPVISGTPVNGSLLTSSQGSWSGSPTTFTYQWKRNGANIAGATNNTYTLTGSDVGTTITVTVTASNVVGNASATSAGVNAVAANLPANTTAPAITGTAESGQTLSVSTGAWTNSPTGYAYQWRRAGTAISGATNNTYLLVPADVGQAITCTVTATNANGSTAATSNSVTPIAGALGPDANGIFDFEQPNGTRLNEINSKWRRSDGSTTIEIECQSGFAQSIAGTGNNGATYLYVNSQAAEQTSMARVASGFGSGSNIFLHLNNDGTNAYYAIIASNAVQLRKNGVYQDQQPHNINLATTSAVFRLRRVGNTITIAVNGTVVLTSTDAAPLTTGNPGFVLVPGTDVTAARLMSWTDNPNATL